MKKKFIALILTLLICISTMSTTVFAAEPKIDFTTDLYGHDYDDTIMSWNVANTVYIHPLSNSIMVIQSTLSNDIGIEYYDLNYNLKGSKIIKSELASFGGFYAIGKYYYLVTGQANGKESDKREVVRITKFDSNWKKIKSCSIYGGNTQAPFAFGNLSMCSSGKYLIIHTCHKKYQQDGINHQASMRFQVDTDTMTITDSFYGHWKKNSGYVSHSFAQYVQMDGNKIVTIDHCDSYPSRAIIMHTYANDVSTGKGVATSSKQYDILSIPASNDVTKTGIAIGGFEVSSTKYIVAGTRYPKATNSGGRNIFLILVDKSTKKSTLKYITTGSNKKCTNPYLVKLATDSYLLMWSEDKIIHYVKIDKNGNTVGKEYIMKGVVSNCQPIVVNGKITWSYRIAGIYNGKEYIPGIIFYSISTSDLSKTSTKFIQRYNNEWIKSYSSTNCEYVHFDSTGSKDNWSVRYLLWRHNSNGYWLWYSGDKISENDKDYEKYMTKKYKGSNYGLGYGYYAISRWDKIDGVYYYFKSNGYMASDEWIDGYYLNKDGSYTYKGRAHWKRYSEGWMYKDNKGWKAVGLTNIDENIYYFTKNGYMQTGWKKLSNNWYYFKSNGHMVKSTSIKIGNTTYKFNSKGICTNK